MQEFWKIALDVAGLGAIVSFVLWSLYKQWLKLPVFALMSSADTYKLFRLFLVLTFLFALTGLGAYLYTRGNKLPGEDASTRELIDTLNSRKDEGKRALAEKRDNASTPEVRQVATKVSEQYEAGMSEVTNALKKGEMNRAHEAQKKLIEELHNKETDKIFDDYERRSFIEAHCLWDTSPFKFKLTVPTSQTTVPTTRP